MKLRILSLLVVASLGVSCVSKSDHEALQRELAACQEDKRAAHSAAQGFQKRLEVDDTRWKSIEAQMSAVLPQIQQDFQAEREKIVSLVPQEVKRQVGDRLDAHFSRLATSLTTMNDDLTGLRVQLEQARNEIAAVKGATEDVGSKLSDDQAALRAENQRLQGLLDEQRRSAADLVEKVTGFDSTYINCVDCEERLKMKEKSREALLALHGDLVTGLSKLQGAAAP